jgi:hypothetical protein
LAAFYLKWLDSVNLGTDLGHFGRNSENVDRRGGRKMANFLEQLVVEWYEFQNYFVRQNINVGRRPKGGYESELDVVAFCPERRRLIHIEPSMDADRWDVRQKRFEAKFAAGKKHIPLMFPTFPNLPEIEHVALLVFGSDVDHPTVGGGRVLLIKDFMTEIKNDLALRPVRSKAVPEQYAILRGLQFAANFWH